MMHIIITTAIILAVTVFGKDCDKTKDIECSGSNKAGINFNQDIEWSKANSIYEFHANDIHGKDVSLDKYKDNVAIIVNVASQCGLTDINYKQLQSLFEKYGESKGLRILAFPSNEFAGQEPGTSGEILDFVKKYNVTFDMYEKIFVNGDNAHPLYKWLKFQKEGSGTIIDGIKWNFTKFLIDKNGKVVSRFAPTTEPFSMEDTIKKYLE
ncbi:PREDICTED: probable phospholipid hydroperoxide glutathione peroxidase [Ceratosolen solmsi marchali]|uniref:Glutathione peroxidase n=1 Tax=Ceratosolen solmsi marchali TaxID=326594 RepID=A0AAJ6YT05_9HYME|nr:PREDICTED: probable phospholipid hydroperoxide glutathione peroxidase [Ceratosolen solmsi marchali]